MQWKYLNEIKQLNDNSESLTHLALKVSWKHGCMVIDTLLLGNGIA